MLLRVCLRKLEGPLMKQMWSRWSDPYSNTKPASFQSAHTLPPGYSRFSPFCDVLILILSLVSDALCTFDSRPLRPLPPRCSLPALLGRSELTSDLYPCQLWWHHHCSSWSTRYGFNAIRTIESPTGATSGAAKMQKSANLHFWSRSCSVPLAPESMPESSV